MENLTGTIVKYFVFRENVLYCYNGTCFMQMYVTSLHLLHTFHSFLASHFNFPIFKRRTRLTQQAGFGDSPLTHIAALDLASHLLRSCRTSSFLYKISKKKKSQVCSKSFPDIYIYQQVIFQKLKICPDVNQSFSLSFNFANSISSGTLRARRAGREVFEEKGSGLQG